MISDGESSMGTASRIQPVTAEMPYRMVTEGRTLYHVLAGVHGRLTDF